MNYDQHHEVESVIKALFGDKGDDRVPAIREALNAFYTRAFTLGRTSALDDAVGVVEEQSECTCDPNKEDCPDCRLLKGLRDLKK